MKPNNVNTTTSADEKQLSEWRLFFSLSSTRLPIRLFLSPPQPLARSAFQTFRLVR
jgi:hypothetical protein